jgi:mannose-6-phosphate isomerase-like protein (cupin superfamily)
MTAIDAQVCNGRKSKPAVLIDAAQIVLPCTNFAELFTFFTEKLGFSVSLIFPADSPSTAVLTIPSLAICLEQQADVSIPPPILTLRLHCETLSAVESLCIPAGVNIIFVPNILPAATSLPLSMPKGEAQFVLSRAADAQAHTTVGRAGMIYRDLIPGRLGGRFIASHITIPTAGEVPDYVHFHRVIFQMIFCRAGWVKVVYEDQGEPFLLQAGDCVLQPPGIRHRVLEASAGLEVIELGCPAIHETVADHRLTLPTANLLPQLLYGGQRFVRHIAAQASWGAWRERNEVIPNFEMADLGIAAATNHLAHVTVLRLRAGSSSGSFTSAHEGEILFFYVLNGALELTLQEANGNQSTTHKLLADDSVLIPHSTSYTIVATAEEGGFSLLRVAL